MMTAVTIMVTLPDDGSLLIGWYAKHWRLALSLEKNAIESSWHFVSDKTLGNFRESGTLESIERQRIANWIKDWDPNVVWD